MELEDGTRIMANNAVVSTIDVNQTFLDYVGEENLEEDFLAMIKNYKWEKWSLCHVHTALEEPPRFKAAEANPDLDEALVYLLGYESSDDLIKQWDMMSTGDLPQKAACLATFPSVHDPQQAPPDRCTGLFSQMAPFDLKDGGPDKWLHMKYKEEIVDYQLATISEYAPNMTRENVLFTYVTTPADIQNKLPNMVRGSYKQGQYHPLQMGYLRPNQDCSHNKTPIKNLFLGGANVYPGGCVIWGPGYICANTVAETYGIEKWWKEPEIVTEARTKGFLP